MQAALKKSSEAAVNTGGKVRHSIAERSALFPLAVGACSVPLPSWVGEIADWKDTPVVMQRRTSGTVSLLTAGDNQRFVTEIPIPDIVQEFISTNGKIQPPAERLHLTHYF